MNTLQLGQTYSTRDGKGSGRVVADSLAGYRKFGVVVSHNGNVWLENYSPSGDFSASTEVSIYDLIIPERKMRTVWLNVHKVATYGYNTEGEARENADVDTVIAIAYPVEVPAE